MRYQKQKDIAKAIELAYDSLKSHLSDVYDPTSPKVKQQIAKDSIGGRKFHVNCVKEYAFIIKTLSDQLE